MVFAQPLQVRNNMEELVNTTRTVRFNVLAAAVGLVLGSAGALAQHTQGPDPTDPSASAQQQSQENATNRDTSRERFESAGSERAEGTSEIAKIAEENSDLSKFVEAVETAGLGDALTSGTEYTVFAPTNDALEQENIDELLQPDNREELVAVLRAHIVADDVDETMTQTLSAVRTIDGGTVEIGTEDGELMIGEAKAEAQDIEVGDSLRVYAVDAVLPRSEGQAAAAAQTSERSPDSQNQ